MSTSRVVPRGVKSEVSDHADEDDDERRYREEPEVCRREPPREHDAAREAEPRDERLTSQHEPQTSLSTLVDLVGGRHAGSMQADLPAGKQAVIDPIGVK